MKAQMIRVISSPSSSTIGFLTLTFGIAGGDAICAGPRASQSEQSRRPGRRYLHSMSSLGGERKIATMLFADLVGSTELASELDPEDLRGRLEPFFDAARAALEQHGGPVEKYIGDAVMAVFGAPVAHGDDPDRAIAAALAVLERVSAIDGNLSVRIGI